MSRHGFRGEILSVPRDPLRHDDAIRHLADGLLVVEGGRVCAIGPYATLAPRFAGLTIEPLAGLIVPGFVDTHVHYPQLGAIAAHGGQLLEWLERHIFPAEAAFADPDHAARMARLFCDALLRHGTTSALVFATVHPGSVEALFREALARDMRLIAGKVLMDLGPDGLRDGAESGLAESAALIARWRGRGRLGYAVTPRFALTSSPDQLTGAGALLARHPDILLHTHIAENRAEIDAVAAAFPQDRDYLAVYERFGLVGPRSVFAHGVHLAPDAMARLAAAGSGIAFCPSSNLFLGSGLFDLAAADAAGVRVGLGSDIGAGTSLSMLATCGEAYKIGQLRGDTLDPFRALYLATAGGAALLGLEDRIGGLRPGQDADFVQLDPAATPLLALRTAGRPLAERLFALHVLGDDRAVAATFLAGRRAATRETGAFR
ncbi:guanine deaminase [Sphingomonas morindae]|uniref:Guanine deaminase n=1 Tax=Sphingomonas morindae TaxID=1541170 RepID=A0ABY4X5B1_9SPHN|nr:guanine deaminase [Sphingomonas morindae]USI72072.1 guanine deaminase [Sphingomonas morindae]